MADVNFKKSAQQIVELIGGNENIQKVSHCVTRVRFTLKDQAKATANKEAVKNVPGVMQVVEAGGQYQVVIGNKVEKMYNEVIAITGNTDNVDRAEVVNNAEKKEKVKPMDAVMKLVSGIMMPIIPGLVGCGIVLALYNILLLFGLVNSESGIGMVIYGIGQTCMYFLPVIIGGSAAKFFGMNTYIGNVVGAAMMYPTFVAAAGSGEPISLFGFVPLTFRDYTSTLFPAIVAVWFASVMYKFFKKVIPDVLQFAFVPAVTILITVPVSLLVIGPVVSIVSTAVSSVMLAVYNFSPVICGIILGGSWVLFIVPLGLHWGFIAIFINNIITTGQEPVMGLLCGIMAYSGTLLAFGLKTKNKDLRSTAFSCAVSNALGISEPGLYGIILQHKETIATSFIGGAIAGIIPAVFHTTVYSMSGYAGIFAIPGYINPDGSMGSLVGAVLCNLASFVLCFLLTWFWKFDPDQPMA